MSAGASFAHPGLRGSPGNAESVSLTAQDGYHLAATRYRTQDTPLGRVVVAGATAVPQGFYRRFAEFCVARGYEVWTLDYRGIGGSRPATLKGFRMSLLDWARLDLASAIDAVPDDGIPLYVVGHSYGGHAVGLLPNHHKVSACYVFGVGAGWHGWMPWTERWRVLSMWHLVLPPLTRLLGYCPWKSLGMGEDLPSDAFWQWRHWCRYPNYFFDDPAMRGIEQGYADVRAPIMAVNALDDRWATPASRNAFIRGYRNATVSTLDLSLDRVASIGHMGYFRPHAQALWANALEWLSAQPADRSNMLDKPVGGFQPS